MHTRIHTLSLSISPSLSPPLSLSLSLSLPLPLSLTHTHTYTHTHTCALIPAQFAESVLNLKFDEEPKYDACMKLFEPLCGPSMGRPILTGVFV